MPDQPDFAALIASRICHDLISPIGAISNGVELLGMEDPTRPELALLSESAANANARIRFFRISFGAARPEQRIARSEVSAILADLTNGGRVAYDWTSPPDLSRREVRLVLLLVQCLETALAYGGKVRITHDQDRWTLTAEAPRLRADVTLWTVLAGSPPPRDLTAAQVQFALVPPALAELGRSLAIDSTPVSISVSF